MHKLTNIKYIKSILNDHNFNFSKKLGQNFIINSEICKLIAEQILEDETGIIEIGPGIGTLTEILAKKFEKVVAVEIDKRLIEILDKTLILHKNIKIINSDIFDVNLNEIISNEFPDNTASICSNLPYYITSQLIMWILESEFNINSLILMVQKEAAERICASPGTRKCGAISVAVRFYSSPKILFDVPKENFYPMPKVDSSVIKLDLYKNHNFSVENKKLLFKIVKSVFLKRRKNILNSLSSGLKLEKEKILFILDLLNLNKNLRAENLKFQDFINISNELSKIKF